MITSADLKAYEVWKIRKLNSSTSNNRTPIAPVEDVPGSIGFAVNTPSLPPDTSANSCSWRGVSNADVEKVLAQYPLGKIVAELRRVSDPPLPLELALPNALAMTSCALSRDNGILVDPATGTPRTGTDRLAVRVSINGLVQGLNLYLFVVAPSMSGKDLGGFEKVLTDLGIVVQTGGSREGIMDGLDYPNPLIRISEFKHYMDARHYNNGVLSLLTTLFTKYEGSDKYANSKRDILFTAPTLLASVQPGIMRDKFNSENVNDGFFGRLLITYLSDIEFWKIGKGLDRKFLQGAVKEYMELTGELRLTGEMFEPLAREVWGSPIRTTAGRHFREMGHRLAVHLTRSLTPTPADWANTGILLRWFINQHERAFFNVGMSESESYAAKRERWQNLIISAIQKCHEKGLPTGRENIARQHNHLTWGCNGKTRKAVLDDMVELGTLMEGGGEYRVV